jgi:hypothetical protein
MSLIISKIELTFIKFIWDHIDPKLTYISKGDTKIVSHKLILDIRSFILNVIFEEKSN